MKIHGLCIVKDESDIIEQCLLAALAWCDHIYVFDNGSTDGSWEMICRLAAAHPAIVAYKRDGRVFSDSLRSEIFNAFRANATEADWWCRLDADEFYVDDPRVFLAKVPPRYGLVVTLSITYYFTDQDSARYDSDPGAFLAQPVQQRLRHYLAHWSEPRFFRHREGMTWSDDDGGFPARVAGMKVYPVRIWLRHYQYRSPEQIERRLRARWPAIQAGGFLHEAIPDWGNAVASIRETRKAFNETDPHFASNHWHDRVVPAASLDFDALDNRYVVDEALLPKVRLASVASELRRLVPKPLRNAIKRAARGHRRALSGFKAVLRSSQGSRT